MLTFIFVILMFLIFGKMLGFAIRAAWGITKILVWIVFLPITLLVFVLQGLVAIAFPILLIVGAISLFALHD